MANDLARPPSSDGSISQQLPSIVQLKDAEAFISFQTKYQVALDSITPCGLRTVLQYYRAYLLRCNLLDFDDILRLGEQLLREQPTVRASARGMFHFTLVDEFQVWCLLSWTRMRVVRCHMLTLSYAE